MIATKDWAIIRTEGKSEISLSLEAIDGQRKEKVMPLNFDQFIIGMRAYREGSYIQDAFPMLSADEREFMLNGMDDLDMDPE